MADLTANVIPKATGATQVDNGTITDNGGVIIGSPTGGAKGAGTLNADGVYVAGHHLAAIPSATDLVGSDGTAYTSVTVGSGLNLTAGTLTAPTGGSNQTTAAAGAATLNTAAGTVTSEALVGATSYTLTLTNSKVTTTSTVLVTAWSSTGAAAAYVKSVTPGAGSVVIVLGTAALTGTLAISFAVLN